MYNEQCTIAEAAAGILKAAALFLNEQGKMKIGDFSSGFIANFIAALFPAQHKNGGRFSFIAPAT